jgi:hypothetical protein
MRRYLTAAAALLALVAAGAVYAVTNDEPPPPTPPWIQADGQIDLTKVPETFEVSGPDGETVVCGNGRTLKVRKELLFGPPAATPAELRARRAAVTGRDFVWRCGFGSNPHLNARLVPEAQDPLRRDE